MNVRLPKDANTHINNPDDIYDTVNHTLSLYVAGDVHTNTIENFWSVLKRGIYGIYHFVSDKHLEHYLDEFAARNNTRHNGTNGGLKTSLAKVKVYFPISLLLNRLSKK